MRERERVDVIYTITFAFFRLLLKLYYLSYIDSYCCLIIYWLFFYYSHHVILTVKKKKKGNNSRKTSRDALTKVHF